MADSRTLRPAPLPLRVAQGLLRGWRGHRHMRYVPAYEALYRGTREDLLARQERDLGALLQHAYEYVPWHRRRMQAAGVDPRRMPPREALAALPPMSKADAAGPEAERLSSAVPASEHVVARTGGTTARRTRFVQEREAVWRKDALTVVFRRFLGWPDGVRTAWLWGAAQDMAPRAESRLGRFKQRVADEWIGREIALSAGELSDERLETYVARLRAFRPQVLQGYPSATDHLARWLLERGTPLRIPLVVLTAEQIFDTQRARIAKALGAKVLAFYGAREHGWIAAECPQEGNAHLNTAGVLLETDAEGRILVTDLLNHAMPFLRYAVGDRGELADAPCPCGDPRPVLARLAGREGDMVELPSGRRVPAISADPRGVFLQSYGLLDLQLVRTAPDRLLARYVSPAPPDASALAELGQRLEQVFFDELSVEFERVARLEPGANGKLRYYLSAPEAT